MTPPEAQLPRSGRRLQRLLAWVLAALCIGGILTHGLVREAQTALRAASDYNPTWVASQSALETTRLQAAISAWEAAPGPRTLTEVQLRAEILAARAVHFETTLGTALGEHPLLRATTEQFGQVTALLPDDLEGLDLTPASAARLRDAVSTLSTRIVQLAGVIYGHTSAQGSAQAERLATLQAVFLAIMVLLFIGCMVLLVGLWRSNLSLLRARDEVVARDQQMTLQHQRFGAALNNMSEGLCMFDGAGRLLVRNAAFLQLFGLDAAVAGQGTTREALFTAMRRSGAVGPALLSRILRDHEDLIRSGRAGSFFRMGPNGQAIELSHQPLADGGWIVTYDDITERRRVEERVMFLAHHDPLTGLPNREMFRSKLTEALATISGGRHLARPTLMFIDLDGFKIVNDTLGHQIGDGLLRLVARRLRDTLPPEATVARIGGDEFAAVLPGSVSADEAEHLAGRLIATVGEPYVIEGQRAVIGTSIGLVSANVTVDSDELLKCADLALYAAKDAGRGRWQRFESALRIRLDERLRLEADLRRAFAENQFEIHYQPVFNLESGRIRSFEALLRWHHPTRGMVSPAEFIPVLEETGQLVEVGRWVLETACREATTWPDRIGVAVNVSPVQFENTALVPSALDALRATGLPGDRLEIEITESSLLSNTTELAEAMSALRAAGIRFALDDFGTGYSSLSYLLRFRFDRIKIDQSFVREMASHPDSLAIVQFTTALAAQTGMATTAEGVETLTQFRQLRDVGCSDIQGWFIGRPIQAGAVREFLARGTAQQELRRIA